MVEIYVNIDKCTGCGDCVKACPPEILFLNANYCNVRENLVPECLGCQSCVVVCPSEAISIKDQLEKLECWKSWKGLFSGASLRSYCNYSVYIKGMAIFHDASDVSEPFWMHLLLSKMHDASDEYQFILMHPGN